MRTRTRSIRLAIVAGLMVAGALVPGRVVGAPAPAADPAPPVPQLHREGRWLVDQYGRVVIVHGVNLVWKRAPYAPPDTAAGFTAADAQWLHDNGFNGVRLGTLWAGVTPDQPGVGDPAYRARWQRVMDLLAQRGIWMQLDMHQDEWSETYGGEGVPAWAVKRPAPYNLFPPVQLPFPLGYWTPEVSTVFDRFWANKDHLRDAWAQAWKVEAGWWRDQPYLMGYDLLNEPWMGMEWPLCLTTGCPGAYQRELQPAMEQATRAVRSVDPGNIVWWEPQQLAAGQQVPTFLRPMAGEDQLGLSWHNYCFAVFLESQHVPGTNVNSCWRFSRERNRNALAQASRMHAVPLMSEWGATDNVPAIKIDAAVADENLMGWLHWAYKRWDDPTTADTSQGLFTDDADLSSVKQDKVRALVRTYAQATAGTPLAMSFDADTGAFSYRYQPDLSITEPTVVFVSPLHYPNGFDVQVDGGTAEQRPDHLLWVRPDPGRATPVTVKITAR